MSLAPKQPLVWKALVSGSGGAGPQSGMRMGWTAEAFRKGDAVWWGLGGRQETWEAGLCRGRPWDQHQRACRQYRSCEYALATSRAQSGHSPPVPAHPTPSPAPSDHIRPETIMVQKETLKSNRLGLILACLPIRQVTCHP